MDDYHVFTGAPADLGKPILVGLSKTDATTKMMILNTHNAKRRKAASMQQPSATRPNGLRYVQPWR